jgi:hypothetical protein
MYTIKSEHILLRASTHYYSEVWQGGKLGMLDWLDKEFGARTNDGVIYFKTEAKRNWFALRFS